MYLLSSKVPTMLGHDKSYQIERLSLMPTNGAYMRTLCAFQAGRDVCGTGQSTTFVLAMLTKANPPFFCRGHMKFFQKLSALFAYIEHSQNCPQTMQDGLVTVLMEALKP